MELWIRSQDKEALIKVDKIFYWNTCPEMPNTGKHYLGNKEWVGNADYTKLGEYNTKERALEVLDEIQLTAVISGIPFREAEEEYKKRNMNVKDRVLLNYKTGGTLYIMPKE